MKRRTLLASTTALVAVSGCTGSSNEKRAEKIIAKIESDVTVDDWTLGANKLDIEYQTTGSIMTDLELIGGAYADAVKDRLIRGSMDVDLEATALGASKEFTFEISKELAKKRASGKLDQDEYIEQIADF